MYVVVEGIDGSGKTTLCRNLLSGMGPDVRLHREPSGGPIGTLIRSKIRMSSDPRMLVSLFASDRMMELPPALEALPPGHLLLSDRSFLSSVAYQGRDDGSAYTLEEILLIHRYVPKPDVVVYLDCPAILSVSRIHGRSALDSFENIHDLEVIRERYARGIDLLVDESMRTQRRLEVFHVDATESVDRVFATVEGALTALMTRRRSA